MELCPALLFSHEEPPLQTTLVILNQPISSLPVLKALWPSANYRICADGGANRLHDALLAESSSFLSQFVRSSKVPFLVRQLTLRARNRTP
jgi:thiamine pyrophosphokinase